MYTLKTFYKSKEWLNLLQVLKLERVNAEGKLICEHCGKELVKAYDIIGHHVIELNDTNVNDYNISLNPDNIQLIHFKCHNQIHERFGYFNQKVYIVYGSPCSGKSTWVKENAYPDDLIIDLDSIWECICTFGIRDTLLDQVRTRTGMWRNAYVIGGYPLATDRQRLADKLGAELIFIDTDKNTCLARAMNDEWKKYIEEWWEDFIP